MINPSQSGKNVNETKKDLSKDTDNKQGHGLHSPDQEQHKAAQHSQEDNKTNKK